MSFFEVNVSKNIAGQGHSHSDSKSFGPNIPQKAPLSFPLAVMRAAVDQKALDVRGLDISACTDIADYFIICSGTSERHVKGIADRIQSELVKIGEHPVGINGYEKGEWVLVDYGDLVVHIFFEPMRQYYGLDELWNNRAELIEPEPDLQEHMRKLRTGIAW